MTTDAPEPGGDGATGRRPGGRSIARLLSGLGLVTLAVVVAITVLYAWMAERTVDRSVQAVHEANSEAIPLLDLTASVGETTRVLARGLILGPEGDTRELESHVARVEELIGQLDPEPMPEERLAFDTGVRHWNAAAATIPDLLAEPRLPNDPEALATFQELEDAAVYFRAAHDTSAADLEGKLDDALRVHDAVVVVVGAAALVALLLGVLAWRRLAVSIVRPLRRLRLGAQRVAAGDLDQPVPEDGPTELRELAESFNEMAADLRSREVELVYQALHDPLTGLGNRALLRDRLDLALARHRRHPEEVLAVVLFDVDGFKNVNDSLGHPVGDEAIVALARRVERQLRDGDALCRLGGDEFAVVLEDAGDALGVVAERVRRAAREPVLVRGHELTLTVSVGVAVASPGQESHELLRDADLAMYDAKRRGGDAARQYEARLHERATERLELENELRSALAHGELEVHYQPTVELRTGRLHGAEALVRWRHPHRGLLPPAVFLPVAEETGLVVPMGWFVLERSLRDLARWKEQHGPLDDFVVSVNVASLQLSSPEFESRVRDALASSGVPARQLVLEVTETMVLRDAPEVVERLEAVRRLGVEVALDDFGTGYSSLQYLREYPVDMLKIDRSFVTGLGRRGDQERLVRTILDLARTFGLAVVAEGVEDEEEVAVLETVGCDLAQGYLFSRPVPAAAIDDMLDEHRGARAGTEPERAAP